MSSYNRRRGMKVGASHDWKYKNHRWKEKKVKGDEWKFATGQSKSRNNRAPVGTGMPVGSKLIWGFLDTKQIMKKVNANKYIGKLAGKKVLLGYKLPKKRTKWVNKIVNKKVKV